jgi:acetyltransferase-like isoleucine patch superfamily enzyme
MTARIHPTALVEDGVEIGGDTVVWDSVHIRAPARIGSECIVCERTCIAPGVDIGDRVKIDSFVYICTGVTIETGVMIAAGVVFTNNRHPRATTSDLAALRPSQAHEHTLPTLVREGATLGARSVIGCDLEIGRFAMVGMGAVVTKTVPDFHLVVGNPARPVGLICRCGKPMLKFTDRVPKSVYALQCGACDLPYAVREGRVVELPSVDRQDEAPGGG